MNNGIKRYGIMGGTFDPIHIGHLVIAEEARNKFNLDKVIFVPSGNPPHKDLNKVTNAIDRYEMTLIATLDNPNFEVSTIELKKNEKTYTVDTLKDLINSCKEETEFYFITGADAILDLPNWKSVDELLELCNFVAATRPGFNLSKMEESIKNLEKKYNKTIYTITVPSLKVSSTDIRNRIKMGSSVKYLLPLSVENYILKNNLYKVSKKDKCY